MWVMLDTGFYSATLAEAKYQDDAYGDDVLQVRGRAIKDIEALADWIESYTGTRQPVLKWRGRDYPARVLITKQLWAEFLVAKIDEIPYSNFKDAVGKVNKKRAGVYASVWATLLRIHDENPKDANRSIYDPRATTRRYVSSTPSTPARQSWWNDDWDDADPDDEAVEGALAAYEAGGIHSMTDAEWAEFQLRDVGFVDDPAADEPAPDPRSKRSKPKKDRRDRRRGARR